MSSAQGPAVCTLVQQGIFWMDWLTKSEMHVWWNKLILMNYKLLHQEDLYAYAHEYNIRQNRRIIVG